jgi:hypothetical protein
MLAGTRKSSKKWKGGRRFEDEEENDLVILDLLDYNRRLGAKLESLLSAKLRTSSENQWKSPEESPTNAPSVMPSAVAGALVFSSNGQFLSEPSNCFLIGSMRPFQSGNKRRAG